MRASTELGLLGAIGVCGFVALHALASCARAGEFADKGCAAIREADAACQWLTIVRADGSTVRVPKKEGIAAMRRAGLEQLAP
jgi:hypothetical protein